MNALLSIHPEYAEAILNGSKRFEFRKAIFRRNVRRIYIYATTPVKAIIGHFDLGEIQCASPDTIWRKCREGAGIRRRKYVEYFAGSKIAVALKVENPVRLRQPLTLKDIGVQSAPQSFQYISDAGGK